jgi:hypothetical protein
MQEIGLRSATSEDATFALYVTEACMRVYAEQTWGSWNGRANFDPALDNIIVFAGQDIGLIGPAGAAASGPVRANPGISGLWTLAGNAC